MASGLREEVGLGCPKPDAVTWKTVKRGLLQIESLGFILAVSQ